MKTLVYAELDDERPRGRDIVGLGVMGQMPGARSLFKYHGPQTAKFMEALSSEATASGKPGWRKIVILVDHDAVTVRREPRSGAAEGFDARMLVEIDRAFPGHSTP